MKLASDQRTTTATSSLGPRCRTRSVTSNSAGVRASFEMPTGSPFTSEVEHALDTAEAEDDAPPAPAARDGERPAVDSGRVCLGYVRRRVAERHHDVRVVRLLVPLHRPQTGHVDPVPAATRPGRGARGGRPVDEPELPYTVERPPQGRRAGVGDRGVRCRVRDERGPGRQSVQALELRRLPARLPAGEQQPVDRGRHALTAAASRSDSAAASGATGLK